MVSLSSEFPNDNPALHQGVIWVCLEPTGRVTADRVAIVEPPRDAHATAHASLAPPEDADEDAAGPIIVEELEPIEASLEGVALFVPNDSTALPPAPDDPFTALVCMLADIAIGAGSMHIAALLPGLLFDGRLPEPLDPEQADALQHAGVWNGTEVAPAFLATTSAWRQILRGTSDDFAPCGAAMLDEWASDMLARLLRAPAPTLRQELRSRGVAAFGLVEAAQVV